MQSMISSLQSDLADFNRRSTHVFFNQFGKEDLNNIVEVKFSRLKCRIKLNKNPKQVNKK